MLTGNLAFSPAVASNQPYNLGQIPEPILKLHGYKCIDPFLVSVNVMR